MQVIIPMSGFGERFRKAGYSIPKPLIEVDEKPIIQHVVEMFPGETNITFICNRDHLDNEKYHMREILEEIAPKGNIIAIEPHKLGPVHAVLQAIKYIDLKEPTIVNYADFSCYWEFENFIDTVTKTNCDGAIPSYRGFHPHTIWSNYYAYIREINSKVIDIQEKQSFTNNPRAEFASSGTYYFKSGELMQQYFEKCVEEKLTVADEYYVSMVYKPMINDGLDILVYELEHFMQWGTPDDLEEYCYWSDTFRSILFEKEPPYHQGAVLLPMVGLGSRFVKEGYEICKPMIQVSSLPMAVQALNDLPKTDTQRFVLRKDIDGLDILKSSLTEVSNKSEFVILDQMTDGQATTCEFGGKGLSVELPVTIAACDNGMLYNSKTFSSLMEDNEIDIIVWGAKGYPGAIRSPEMYGWIEADQNNGIIQKISVKKPLKNPLVDSIVVGTFTFKRYGDFVKSLKLMRARDAKVNGEFYVDTLINDAIGMGLRCVVFDIDHYICWGTPNDLRTFEYWQNCFHKWKSHPYNINNDKNYKSNN